MSDLARIESRMEELRRELQELELAARVLRRLHLEESQDELKDQKKRARRLASSHADLEGTSMVQAAQAVLADRNGEGMHYKKITEEAVARGYRGRERCDLDKLKSSFYSTMKRRSDLFQKVKRSFFRLK